MSDAWLILNRTLCPTAVGATVQPELMEEAPPIVAFLEESRLHFPVVVSQPVVPVTAWYLEDPDNHV